MPSAMSDRLMRLRNAAFLGQCASALLADVARTPYPETRRLYKLLCERWTQAGVKILDDEMARRG